MFLKCIDQSVLNLDIQTSCSDNMFQIWHTILWSDDIPVNQNLLTDMSVQKKWENYFLFPVVHLLLYHLTPRNYKQFSL